MLRRATESPGVSTAGSPLTIGFVVDDSLDRPDGVQQYVFGVGEWLRARGHEVHYLTSTTRPRDDIAHIHSLARNVAVRFNGNALRIPLPAPYAGIRTILAAERFDVLHIQTPYSPLLAGRIILAADNGVAVVGTFHIVPRTWLVGVLGRVLAWWCRRSLRRFDAMVSVSAPAQRFARHAFGLRSTIVPNPIRLEMFRTAKAFPRSTPGVLEILFLGRLVPRKGCRVLLEAIRLLRDESALPAFHVTICGEGPLLEPLKSFVDAAGLSSCVRFAGFVTEADKPRYYASADVTVFPSQGGESFGIVLAEAMASGRSAVLAGDNEGYRSVLEACPYDVLFDPAEAKELAARLRALLIDANLRQQIAEWQAQYAKRFDVERVGPELLSIYRSALRGRQNVR